jgi:hypothetical protein
LEQGFGGLDGFHKLIHIQAFGSALNARQKLERWSGDAAVFAAELGNTVFGSSRMTVINLYRSLGNWFLSSPLLTYKCCTCGSTRLLGLKRVSSEQEIEA